jgi:DNA replication protein DnaC
MAGEFNRPDDGLIAPASFASLFRPARCGQHDAELVDGKCPVCAAEHEQQAAERARVLAHWRTDDYQAASRAEDTRLTGLNRWREVMGQFPLIRDAPLIPRPQRNQVLGWAQHLSRSRPPGNLVLSGARGQGKTWDILHAVEAAYQGWFRETAIYADRELWLRARPVSPSAEHDPALLRQWQTTGLLVIDDAWGDSPLGERDADFLYLILNRRCNTPSRPTVLVTSLPDLRPAFGYAVSSRLRSPAVTVIQYGGQPLRGSGH